MLIRKNGWGKLFICLMLSLFLGFALITVMPQSATAATTELTIKKLASDGVTVLAEKTVDYRWLMDPENIEVMGNGETHYYHQGPVFIDDLDPDEQERLRWNEEEDTNYLGKDMGAARGTNVRDLCKLVGGMKEGETLQIKAVDGLKKTFAYKNVYEYSEREGPMVVCWETCWEGDVLYPDTGYKDGMRLVWFADDSVNPDGLHVFGNFDWKLAADPEYWYYYQDGSEKYPTTTGLSVKYVSELTIYSNESVPEPKTWYVDGSGSGDFTTIQEAITASGEGDTIIVKDGTYTENVKVDKALTIQSENGALSTTVNAAVSTTPVFSVDASGAIIDGFSIQGATGRNTAGIEMVSVTDCTIRNNICSGGYNGIHLGGAAANNMIIGNYCHENSKRGISVRDTAHDNFFVRNTVENNDAGFCIKDMTKDNVLWLNNIIGDSEILTGNTYNSPAPLIYNYKGSIYTGYLGNYWENYTGIDIDGDGVGDTPHNNDCYPLMELSANYVETDEVVEPTTYTVIFVVTDGENAIEDATIVVKKGEDVVTPQADGTYNLEAGEYSYTVTKEGYKTAEGTIIVEAADITETVSLEEVTIPEPKTLYVDGSGSGDFTTIQEAVTTANVGDTIVVKDGTYTENVLVDKSLVIRSENGADLTTVQAANEKADVFKVTAENVTIEGFTVSGATSRGMSGISICSPSSSSPNRGSCTVINNKCSGNNQGITLKAGTDNMVTNNTCTLSGNYGIYLNNTTGNFITDNICSKNTSGSGFALYLADNANNNTVNGNISSSNNIGIRVKNAHFNTIFNNTCSNNDHGLEIATKSANNMFYLNNFIDNTSGQLSLGFNAIAGNSWNSLIEMPYSFNGKQYNGFVGNYWGDYTGTDADGNGIGDTPYQTVETDSDNYPLMGQWKDGVIAGSAAATHTVTFSAGQNGTLLATVDDAAINSGDKVEEGKSVVFTAVPVEGYQVKGWTLGGETVADNTTNTLTVENLAADIIVAVEFEAIPVTTYTLTLTGEGLISNPEAGEIAENTEVTITVTAPEGKQVATFTVGGVDKKAELVDGKYILIITADTEVAVAYEAIKPTTYTVIFTVTDGETAIEDATIVVKKGEDVVTPQADGTYNLEAGEYSYTVSAEGYVIKSDIFTVTEEGQTVTVVLEEQVDPDKPQYNVIPADDTIYTIGATDDGIKTMTVDAGQSGFKYFTVSIEPVVKHEGTEVVVFTHLRDMEQLQLNATEADFDVVDTAKAGFNVEQNDVVKLYVMDQLTNDTASNPILLQ
ncbi:MAG: hypothetical protein GX964_03060 [Syntrophomonadaceae bacterium]|nr:hypothetical protein [Syntrophomonadaceae bacterium]